ncbi:MAG: helix-turn-helix domain-containing protein [Ginsengibacter sp.]
MAKELNIQFQFPIDELATAVAEKLIPFFNGIKREEISPPETYKTRKETAVKLKVSLPTLNEYTKRGLIIGYRFGVRVMYKESEIEAALIKMNFGRSSHE